MTAQTSSAESAFRSITHDSLRDRFPVRAEMTGSVPSPHFVGAHMFPCRFRHPVKGQVAQSCILFDEMHVRTLARGDGQNLIRMIGRAAEAELRAAQAYFYSNLWC